MGSLPVSDTTVRSGGWIQKQQITTPGDTGDVERPLSFHSHLDDVDAVPENGPQARQPRFHMDHRLEAPAMRDAALSLLALPQPRRLGRTHICGNGDPNSCAPVPETPSLAE
jgi:hypothetical protein